MQRKPKITQLRAKEAWMDRLKKLRPRMPKDHRQRLITQNPEYDTMTTSSKLSAFWAGRTKDLALYDALCVIAEQYEHQQPTPEPQNAA